MLFCRGHRLSALDNPVVFWKRVERTSPDACWEWQGFRNKDGYGQIRTKGNRLLRAHRVAYELTYGPIPEGVFICHHCDNPPCCNPNPGHLFAGTPQANVTDMKNKGRESHDHGAKGSANAGAKLTESQVVMIRQRYAAGGIMQKTLAQEHGLTLQSVNRIIRRRTWTHL